MKIIISPSKTQTIDKYDHILVNEPRFSEKTAQLVEWIKSLEPPFLGEKMKIKGDLLSNTVDNYRNFQQSNQGHAIVSYTGTVFKALKLQNYSQESLMYMKDHLLILSALYGVLEPFDGIRPYRLDMKLNLFKTNLYSFWKKELEEYFMGEQVISLASTEFSKMIPKGTSMIQLDFKEQAGETFKTLGYYAKVARGMMLNILIEQRIDDLEQIKTITFDGYSYNEEISSNRQWYFTRLTK